MYYPVPEISFKDGLWLTLTFIISFHIKSEPSKFIQLIGLTTQSIFFFSITKHVHTDIDT